MYSEILSLFIATICANAVMGFRLETNYCTPQGFGACLNSVDAPGSDVSFCARAEEAMLCVSHLFHECILRNEDNMLEALASQNIVGLHAKMMEECR